MPLTVTETTAPACADWGMRTFEVQMREGHLLDFAICQRVREDCPGEIHATDELNISEQPANNTDLTAALRALLDAAVIAPGHTSSLRPA